MKNDGTSNPYLLDVLAGHAVMNIGKDKRPRVRAFVQ